MLLLRRLLHQNRKQLLLLLLQHPVLNPHLLHLQQRRGLVLAPLQRALPAAHERLLACLREENAL